MGGESENQEIKRDTEPLTSVFVESGCSLQAPGWVLKDAVSLTARET